MTAVFQELNEHNIIGFQSVVCSASERCFLISWGDCDMDGIRRYSRAELERKIAERSAQVMDQFCEAEKYSLKAVMKFGAGIVLLFLFQFSYFSDVYSVQLSRFTGGYVNTDAVVEHYTHMRKRAVFRAVTPDNTVLRFSSKYFRTSNGATINVSYNRNSPSHAYVNDFRYSAPSFLAAAVIFGGLAWMIMVFNGRLKGYRKLKALKEGSQYVLLEADLDRDFDKTVKTSAKGKKSEYYACWYKLEVEGYAPVIFHGIWHLNLWTDNPELLSRAAVKEAGRCRIYMYDVGNPDEMRYFIEEVR